MNDLDMPFIEDNARINRRKMKGQSYRVLCVEVMDATMDRLRELAAERRIGIGKLLDDMAKPECSTWKL